MQSHILSIGNPGLEELDLIVSAYRVSQEAAGCTPKTLSNLGCAYKSYRNFLFARTAEPYNSLPLSAELFREYIVYERRRGQSDRSVQTYLITLRGFCRWTSEEGYTSENPMSRVKTPRIEKKVLDAFTDAEIRRLLASTSLSDDVSIRNRAIVAVLLDTGLRASEFVDMRVGDIDLETGAFVVMGKGRKQRHVRVGATARKSLFRYLRRSKTEVGARLWQGCRGPLTVSGLFQVLDALGKQCGVLPCNPHKFRRTFALNCLRNGMDPFSLQLLMGHSDMQILRTYLAQTQGDVQKAHERHSPLDNMGAR